MAKNELPASQQSLVSKNDSDDDKLSVREAKIQLLINKGFTRDNIEMIADLTKKERSLILNCKLHGKVFSDPVADLIVEESLVLSVSNNRKGRKELTDLAKELANEQENDQSILKNLTAGR